MVGINTLDKEKASPGYIPAAIPEAELSDNRFLERFMGVIFTGQDYKNYRDIRIIEIELQR